MKNIYIFLRYIYWTLKNCIVFTKLFHFLFWNRCKEKNILLLLVPIYENLGDQAIAVAEETFFSSILPEKKVLEISNNLITPISYKILRLFSCKFSCFVITGGGFLGTLWLRNENQVRSIVKGCVGTKLVVFPQSIFFENSLSGKVELDKTKQVLCLHKNVVLFLRDHSFNFAMRNLSDIEGIRIFNVPDIVCFLNRSEQSGKRNGILFCMRNDIEKTSCNEDIERLKQYLKEYNYTITSTDTLTGYSIKKKNRRLEVDKKLQLFKTKEIVITDRLHGMLFCLITGTPCIALNNVSKKIEGVWKLWLQEYDYIKYYESLKNIDINIVKSMILKTNIVYNPDSFSIYWNMIKEELK